ncbi:MAG: hypothetical protein GF317_00640 [Candidatus Lokiarchaeota archaeon]|nr:hypothetical protein [Candidatus Lokiarchaeota archaeon]
MKKFGTILDNATSKCTKWLGSITSIILHTLLFVGSFVLIFFGIPLNTILLVLTTAVSLEAIYLALFIQRSVNKNTEQLEDVAEDIDDIQEDIDEIQDDIDGFDIDDVKVNTIIEIGGKEVSEETIKIALRDYFTK